MISRSPHTNGLILAALSVLVVTALFVGCKKKESPPVVSNAPPVSAQPDTQQPKPVQKTVSSTYLITASPEVDQFDFNNKKDPFKPYITLKPATNASQNGERKKLRDALPIHMFDVNQFKLIGIITGGRENRAMVTDPNGKGYVLKAGMTIGKNDGRITLITNSGVDVVEQFKDDKGRVGNVHIKMTLPRKY